MAYIGKTPSQAVRSRYFYTAAGGETSLSGADDNGDTLIFADGNYVDVYLNGVLLVASSDYNVNTVNTIAGLTALTALDIVEIVVYDTFSVFGGVFQGDLSADTITGDMFGSHQFEAKNIEGSTIPKGTPVYIAGHSGNDPEIAIADADDPAKMPAFGITTAAIANNNKGNVIIFGNYIGLDTSGFSVGDELYISNTGTLVNTRPSASADKVQKIAKVIRSQSQNGQIFVMGAGRSNDVPNAITTNSINLSSTTTVDSVLDEDTMTSDSATALATQQSIKAYVDSQIGSNNELSEILTNGNTTGGNDISFGDNDKAIFGAGSDLQIYHDAGNSRIVDAGTGNLNLQADNNINILNNAGTEFKAQFITDGAVNLFYDNSKKFETTATGVDVTGTVTADGLTVDGNATINDNFPYILLNESDTTDLNTRLSIGSGLFNINTLDDAYTVATQRFRLDNATGDISFYDDTGVTQGFFWDASAERLGIGTTSPSDKLSLEVGAVNAGLSLYYSGTEVGSFRSDAGNLTINADNASIKFATGGTERMRINSTGNVGIGTSSPAYNLDVYNSASTGAPLLARFKSAGGDTQLYVDNSTITTQLTADSFSNSGIVGTLTNHPFVLRTNNTERLRIDSSGRVTMPYQPSFAATRNQGDVSNAVYVYPNVYHNTGNHYNSSNGRFTAPVTGSYFLSANHMTSNGATYNNYEYHIRVNGSLFQLVYSSSGGNLHHRWNWHGVMYLQAGDYVDVFIPAGFSIYGQSSLYQHFSGYLLG